MEQLTSAILASIRESISPSKCSDYMSAIREEGGDVKEFRELVNDAIRVSDDAEEIESYLRCLFESYCYGARESFDDFMVAMEWDREPKAKFWLPRRSVLEGKHKVASEIQNFIWDDDAEYLGFSMPPGTGKALADDTPVITRNGWKKHGDLVVGDEAVGIDGKFKKVLAVHPKCMVDRLITFSNGEQIQCHEKHEWLLYDRASGTYRLKETGYWENRSFSLGVDGHRGHRYTLQMPTREYIEGEEKELPLDPYTFGVWLGDGVNKNPTICNAVKDYAIIERILANGIEQRWESTHKDTGVKYYGFNMRFDLQKMGLCHSRRTTPKYIPECYLTASIEQRLQLLAGLLDTDGTRNGKKYCFTTVEETLKNSFCDLISTFGWRYWVMVSEPQTSSSGVTGRRNTYIIGFTPDCTIPCTLERKRISEPSLQRRIGIVNIEKIEPKQGNCITVEDGMYLVGKTMLPTHNSTLIKFLLCWIYGLFPRSSNMYVSYSDAVVKMIYDSVHEMLTDGYEYRFRQIFPEVPVPRVSAEYYTISARNKGDFPTIGMISLGGSVTGRTRANKLLITDDLVKNKEVARSPMRLMTLYDDYKNTLTTRTIGDNVKQIQLGTIWSVHDPISRMKAEHEGDSRYRFIAIPVEDEEGNSNFEYEHPDRYNKERIAELKASLDPVDFSCLYMQQGMEKEGLAFPSEQLLYYNGVLPEGEPDDIEAWCDVAFGGGDSLCMPIAYIYGESVYIHDVIFDRHDKKVTEPRVADALKRNEVKLCGFEANAGGEFYAREVDELLRQNDYRMNIQSKRAGSNMSKVKRIEQYVPTIKEWYFRDSRSRSREYQKFMEELCSFSFTQKNLHDDAPDGLAGLCEKMYKKVGKIEVVQRRF